MLRERGSRGGIGEEEEKEEVDDWVSKRSAWFGWVQVRWIGVWEELRTSNEDASRGLNNQPKRRTIQLHGLPDEV